MDIFGSTFSPSDKGYAIYRSSTDTILDERLIGPNHIDSFGSLRETPGVGWQ
jgi:hypothetical protein